MWMGVCVYVIYSQMWKSSETNKRSVSRTHTLLAKNKTKRKVINSNNPDLKREKIPRIVWIENVCANSADVFVIYTISGTKGYSSRKKKETELSYFRLLWFLKNNGIQFFSFSNGFYHEISVQFTDAPRIILSLTLAQGNAFYRFIYSLPPHWNVLVQI